jgi:branched-chain amino acid transport system substrate-binding protein
MKVKSSLLVAGFILGMLVLSGCVGQEEEVVGEHPLDGKTIEVGIIHADPATATQELAAAQIAIDEVHDYVEKLGIDVTFTLLPENAEKSATKAGEKFDTLVARGVKFVLGLRWSGHVKACLDKANAENVLIISGASTAVDLEIDDWAYRMPVADTAQGKAMAEMAMNYGDGIKAFAGIYRGDTWGEGLYKSFEGNFKAMGGTALEPIRYDPEKMEFAAEAELLDGYVDDLVDQGFAMDEIGIMYVGFQTEGVQLLTACEPYDNLMGVQWMGSDGTGFAELLGNEPENEGAGHIAVRVRLTSTLMYFTKTETYFLFNEKFFAETGENADIYYSNAYDSAWLLSKAILMTASDDSVKVRAALPKIAEQHMGASGWCKMNEYGDRFGADFNIWAVVRTEEAINPDVLHPPEALNQGWQLCGFYNVASNTVTWFVDTPMSVG